MSAPLFRRPLYGLLALALSAVPSFAQNGDIPPEKGFRRSRVFTMPFSLPSADKQRTQQIKLFVKPEPGGEWQVHATASPAQLRYDARSGLEVGEFDVRLDRDGVYNFAVMTVFTDGKSEPATPDQLRPDMRMIIDTRPPTITLRALQARTKSDGQTVVSYEWKVEDENLNRNSIRLEGRWYGGVGWTNFFRGTGPEEDGRQEWTLKPGQRMEVRLSATDRAGNQSWKTLILGAGVGNVTGASASGGGSDSGPILSQPNYRLINTKTVNLTYRVRERPPSGLKEIELWWTRLGTDWKKLEKPFPAPDANSETAEVTFEAPEDGAYGFIMIATSRAGVASQPPPKANDTPQLWVEVDTKQPDAQIKTAKLSNPADGRTLILEWEAKDKNIEALPIIFEYAEVDSKTGVELKWQELTTPLPNSGRYVCATPQLRMGCYLFRVRMHVFDKAGNITTIEWSKEISADVARPQIEIIDVKHPKRGSSPAPQMQTAPDGGSSEPMQKP
jgi:hypothetical protein